MLIPIDPAVNRRVPFATWTLIALNTAIFIFMFSVARGREHLQQLFFTYGAVPTHLTAQTVVTHMFLHAHAGHLVGNMVWLAFFGMKVTDLKMWKE